MDNNNFNSKENLGHGIKGEINTTDKNLKNNKDTKNSKNNSSKNDKNNMDELL